MESHLKINERTEVMVRIFNFYGKFRRMKVKLVAFMFYIPYEFVRLTLCVQDY